jgi:hypothetical protein
MITSHLCRVTVIQSLFLYIYAKNKILIYLFKWITIFVSQWNLSIKSKILWNLKNDDKIIFIVHNFWNNKYKTIKSPRIFIYLVSLQPNNI